MRRCVALARQVSSRWGGGYGGSGVVHRTSSSSSFSKPPMFAASATATSPKTQENPSMASRAQNCAEHKSNLAVMTDRGAYDERTIPHVTGCTIKNLDVIEGGKHVQVTWEDDKISRFHTLWLRHTCFCSACRFDGNGQPKLAYDQVPSDLLIESAVDDGEGCITVKWKGEGTHSGVFPLKHLKHHCYSKQSMEELRDTMRMRYSKDTTIPRVTYKEVMESDRGVLKWCTILNERGICLVEGVPTEPGNGRKVCERISRSVIPTIYGFIEDVKSRPVAWNAGYSTDELKLHMDLVYYASPPGLQALFCLKFDKGIEGGQSMFADMFHVAETFREKHPQDFNVLATVPATLDTIHYKREWPVHMNVKRPMLTLNDHGDLIGVRYQPHHLGPPHVSEELIEPFYAAYKKFYTMTNTWPHKFLYRLQEGDLVTYNNRRMAHGRTAFKAKPGQERHLQGCYLNVSEMKSRMQTLSNLIGDGRIAQRVGDYDFM